VRLDRLGIPSLLPISKARAIILARIGPVIQTIVYEMDIISEAPKLRYG